MTCYHPWTKRQPEDDSLRLPCGGCIGCRLEQAQQWALRCRHEAACWDSNYFLTLTYDEDHLEWHGSLNPDHPRKFLRALRKRVSGAQRAPGSDRRPIRFFGCGEYGSQRLRAHYHLLLFNLQLRDLHRYGSDTFCSDLVSELWPRGSHLLGKFTPAAAAYVAGYCLKKQRRHRHEDHYGVVDADTGEWYQRHPDFNMMSRRPGIGRYWYERYKSELQHGYCVADGKQVAVPRLYRTKLQEDAPLLYEEMQSRRAQQTRKFDPTEQSEERLAVRERVAAAKRNFFSHNHLED